MNHITLRNQVAYDISRTMNVKKDLDDMERRNPKAVQHVAIHGKQRSYLFFQRNGLKIIVLEGEKKAVREATYREMKDNLINKIHIDTLNREMF